MWIQKRMCQCAKRKIFLWKSFLKEQTNFNATAFNEKFLHFLHKKLGTFLQKLSCISLEKLLKMDILLKLPNENAQEVHDRTSWTSWERSFVIKSWLLGKIWLHKKIGPSENISPHCEIQQCRNEWKSTWLNIHYTCVVIIVSRNLIKIAKVAYNYVYEMSLQKEITEN